MDEHITSTAPGESSHGRKPSGDERKDNLAVDSVAVEGSRMGAPHDGSPPTPNLQGVSDSTSATSQPNQAKEGLSQQDMPQATGPEPDQPQTQYPSSNYTYTHLHVGTPHPQHQHPHHQQQQQQHRQQTAMRSSPFGAAVPQGQPYPYHPGNTAFGRQAMPSPPPLPFYPPSPRPAHYHLPAGIPTSPAWHGHSPHMHHSSPHMRPAMSPYYSPPIPHQSLYNFPHHSLAGSPGYGGHHSPVMPHPAPYFPGLSTNNWKFRRESPQPQQQLPRQRSGNGNMHARHDDAKAMWVGNLPENVSTGEIHEFFRECDIVNIANLSRSRCAFINLTSAIEVERAVKIYNNAVFRGCSIVCRPRKMATGGQSSGTTPMHQPEHHGVPSGSRNLRTTQISQSSITTRPTQPDSQPSTPQYQDRYFILKSLTIDDLHIARDRGCWATQPKNEPILNKAFGNSVNVYLIFSANKSGEFYGYARMESGIDPATSSAADLNVDWMPVGAPTIVNTSAAQHQDHHASLQNRVQAPSTCWGTPFSIRWICTDPLPFSQVKHLRNSWNANKQVKVSRDGIEVESSIGKRLLEEFHKNAITSHPPPGDDPDQLDFARLKLDPPSESFLNVLDPGASTRPTAAAAFSRRHSLDLPHPVPEHFVTNQEDLRKRRMSDVKGDGRHPTAWQEYAVQAAAAHVAAHAAE